MAVPFRQDTFRQSTFRESTWKNTWKNTATGTVPQSFSAAWDNLFDMKSSSNRRRRRPLWIAPAVALVAAAWLAPLSRAADLDLSKAVIAHPPNLTAVEQKAVVVLREEVAKRTGLELPVETAWPATATSVIAVGPLASLRGFAGEFATALGTGNGPAEGYRIRSSGHGVAVAGNDSRGVLYGVGRLLRTLRLEPGSIRLPENFSITTAPAYPLRGQQLGYRPKTNSYDGWTVPMWEQYIRDLAVFGNNAVELIPPRSDDAANSPHFPLPQIDMMVEMSRILDSYGMDVWIWYPAMDKDYSDPKTVEFALQEWAEVFQKLPRIDAVFVPGGDPGHTEPKYLMALLEKQAASLHRYHPKAQMWMSPQSFSAEWLDEFFGILKSEPDWLAGVVFGPQVRISLPELRAKVPQKYPIRRYPDITHSRQSQYPVPDWDLAYSLTEAREVINPRPVDEARIFRLLRQYAIGFITYSEGCNDDVNKIVWSGLGWDPDANILDILRDYSRYFIGSGYADDFAQGLLALERNWRGPLLTNEHVEVTLERFRDMERNASPQTLLNWRFQQALYRAYYDAYDHDRLVYETALEQQALSELRLAPTRGSLTAMNQAKGILERALTAPVSQDLRARVFELAEALYQSVRMQLSVPRYKAISVGRGANLDTIDEPLNNRVWLGKQFDELAALPDEKSRLEGIAKIVDWKDPGPGGFYDDLGNLTAQPHLLRGLGYEKDPAHLQSSLVGFGGGRNFTDYPISWWRHAEALNDTPLQMHYDGLDPAAQYRVKVVYAGDSTAKIRLDADDAQVHPLLSRPVPFHPLEFDIPRQATADGAVTLTWRREAFLGGNGRGNQVAEVWLMKKAE